MRRRGGRRDVCATFGFVVYHCHGFFVVRFERDFSSFSSLRGNPIQRRYEKEESALINLKFKDIFRIFVSFDLIFLYDDVKVYESCGNNDIYIFDFY